jgi:ElaB/YqjD/DUF883 family membrane-anchored ribosome-binding protein
MNEMNDVASLGTERLGESGIVSFKETVAGKLHAAADAIQDRAKQNAGHPMSSYARQAADFLDGAAGYVQRVDPEQVKSDIRNQVRQNPGKSLLIAGAVGLLVGVLVRR